MKDVFKQHIKDPKCLHSFAIWAFGEDYSCKRAIELLEAWNVRRGDKLKLCPSGNPVEDAAKMALLWKEHLNEPKTWENFD